MYQNRPRRFRRHSNGRNNRPRNNGDSHVRLGSNSFSNSQTRNHFRTPQSAEKLFEKYNTLAKEALSSGDKTLSENYLQHADHFMRIIDNKNINQNQNRIQTDGKLAVNDKSLDESIGVNKSLDESIGVYKSLDESSGVNQDKIIEEKEEKKE